MDEELEEIHFKRVLKAFSTFSNRMKRRILKHYDDWNRLSQEDQQNIPEYKQKLDNIESTFSVNQEFFDAVVSFTTGIEPSAGAAALTSQSFGEDAVDLRMTPTDRDYENLRSTLRQMVREWSDEGAQERKACFSPILNYLSDSYPAVRNDVRILVPGAGLGRLAWEINRLGFEVQGNEFSLYMLLTSQLIMNKARFPGQYRIVPFAFPLSNHLREGDSLRVVSVPDMTADTGLDHRSGDFSMTAGDFVEIYSRPEELGSWDCIVTCFFLDTAQNVLEYLRVIRGALNPDGGVWINLGPLQYHFESAPEMSVELTWEEIVLAAGRIGFEFEERRVLDGFLAYANDDLGLSRTVYRAVFSVARTAPPRRIIQQ